MKWNYRNIVKSAHWIATRGHVKVCLDLNRTIKTQNHTFWFLSQTVNCWLMNPNYRTPCCVEQKVGHALVTTDGSVMHSPCREGTPCSDTGCWRPATASDGRTATMTEFSGFWSNKSAKSLTVLDWEVVTASSTSQKLACKWWSWIVNDAWLEWRAELRDLWSPFGAFVCGVTRVFSHLPKTGMLGYLKILNCPGSSTPCQGQAL